MSASAPSLGRFERFLLVWKAKILLLFGLKARASEVFEDILRRVRRRTSMRSTAWATPPCSGANLAPRTGTSSRSARLSPQLSNAQFNLAFVAEALGHLDEAEQGFRAALAIEEKMDRAWYGLGIVLVRQGRLPEALAALKRNTALQPMSPFGWYQMARVHIELQQPDEAKAVIRHLKGFEPKVAAQLERETGLRPV